MVARALAAAVTAITLVVGAAFAEPTAQRSGRGVASG